MQELVDILPEIGYEETPETETTPLYPSNGMLTGQIEMSHDVSTEIPAVNIQSNIKPSPQPKLIFKPYTGREMNISSAPMPQYVNLKSLAPTIQKQETLDLGNEIKQIVDKAGDNISKMVDKVGAELAYQAVSSEPIYHIQKYASKNKVISDAIENHHSPNATKYYRISATHGRSVLDGTDDDNMIFTVDKVPDAELKNHILDIIREYRGNRKMMVVQPKEGSRLMNEVKYSRTVVNALKNNLNKKIINLDFTGESDLYRTLGHAHIYKPYRDRNGNVVITIVDYYDFADTDERTLNGALVKNAHRQQEERELSNYVLLIELKYTAEEWRGIRYNG